MGESDLWVVSHLRPEAPRLLLGTGALICTSLVNLRTGAHIKGAIEAEPGSASRDLLRGLAVFGVGAVAGCVRTCIFNSATERLRAKLVADVFAARMCIEPAERAGKEEASDGSSTAAVLDSDVAMCAEAVVKVQNLVRYSFSVVGGTWMLFSKSWKLSVAVWPLLVTGAVHGAKAGSRQASTSAQKISAARAEALGFLEERLQHANLVRWFSRTEPETAAFREKCGKCVTMVSKTATTSGIAHMVADFAGKGFLLGLSTLGSKLVQRGELTAGELTAYVYHAGFLALGLYGLMTLMPEVTVARAAAKRLSGTVQAGNASVAAAEALACAATPAPSKPPIVSFEGVRCSYPGCERRVLDGFSLNIPAGTTCALVGPSGSGKSTAVAMLLRDVDPDEGRVLVDGRDIREVPRHGTRGALGVAPQQPILLGTSVTDAIAFGVPDAGAPDASAAAPLTTRIEAAARTACAHDFVLQRPAGYESPVGRGGQSLSGGERQRVAMARALVREAPVLVLDEPTSALDAATGSAVVAALLAPRRDRPTTLIVTHSLPLIRCCDAVAVMSPAGRVVQHGTFPDLVADQEGALAQIMKAGELVEDDADPVAA